jgi:hypothetical protein
LRIFEKNYQEVLIACEIVQGFFKIRSLRKHCVFKNFAIVAKDPLTGI